MNPHTQRYIEVRKETSGACQQTGIHKTQTQRETDIGTETDTDTDIIAYTHTHTQRDQWPMSRNRTCLGVAESSGRSIVFGRPQHSAVAAVSLSRRNTLSPAMMDASSTARRCASVNQHGTDTTQSGDAPLLCASAAYATLRHYMQLMCMCTRPTGTTAAITANKIRASPPAH